jgi:uncharacterized membrane protein YoaK (UPF0700 family)
MPRIPAPSTSFLAAFGLVLAIVALAGFVDAYSFLQFQGLFVSFMSGNTTALGVAAAAHDAPRLAELLPTLGCFVAGVVLGALAQRQAGPWATTTILALVAGLLLLAHLRPALALGGLPLAMGVLNAAVHDVGGVRVSLTFVTGALVRFGTGLADVLTGQASSWDWLWQLLLWLGFGAGAWAGSAFVLHLRPEALPVAAAFSAVLALLAGLVRGLS